MLGVGVVTRKGYALKNGGNQIWVEFKYFMIPVFETHLYPTFPPTPNPQWLLSHGLNLRDISAGTIRIQSGENASHALTP